jgi:hypothetical protein
VSAIEPDPEEDDEPDPGGGDHPGDPGDAAGG